jgi:hypothetical protein
MNASQCEGYSPWGLGSIFNCRPVIFPRCKEYDDTLGVSELVWRKVAELRVPFWHGLRNARCY